MINNINEEAELFVSGFPVVRITIVVIIGTPLDTRVRNAKQLLDLKNSFSHVDT